jgi:signal peptidase I
MRRLVRNLAVVTVLGIMALIAAAMMTGRCAIVVTHGVSMQPTYHQGDLVLVTKANSYRVGQIVAYRGTTAHDLVVLHRIIGGDASGFVFKGDNNESTDPVKPTGGELIGRAIVHIPQGGLWLRRATSPPALALIAFGLIVGGGTLIRTRRTVLRNRSRRNRTTVSGNADRPHRPIRTPTTLSPLLRTTAGAIAAVGVLAAALAALAWAGPKEHLTTAQKQTAPSMTFAYSAAVPQTPAYDGTIVSAPDPVFRKLAHSVEVRFAYQGPPGSVVVTAELSTTSGWHTTMPLADTTAFTQSGYDGVVLLDLDAIDARASAAAAVIGLPAGPVNVAVVPRVIIANGATFAPTLRLNLTPLQLTLAGASETLVVKGAVTPGRPTLVPRTLGLQGRTIMTVATARALSAYLALGALLAAVAFTLAARLSVPTSEGAGIRRRYGSLLVRVDPMPTPPGRPVVNVPEFKTLVRLAERYELMILHWARNNAETFIVQDEGTTYRYRCNVSHSPVPTDENVTAGV